MSDAEEALKAFKDRVEAFLAVTGMPESRFGRLACRDGSFVADLRNGARECRASTIKRVDVFMMAHLEQPPVGNAIVSGDPSRDEAA